MNKIIFLDIDGVLNCSKSKLDSFVHMLGIDDDKIARLKRIVDNTGAKIVLTTSWKDDWFPDITWKNMQGNFGNLIDRKMNTNKLIVIGKTDDNGYDRGAGIIEYLHQHQPDNFIILDNEWYDFEKYYLEDKVIFTDFYNGGLTDELADKAIHQLNNIKAKRKVIGAIGGDIMGSQYEFKEKANSIKDVKFTDYCRFTDDTVMTIAVMDYLINKKDKLLSYYLKKWCKKYPNAGYGSMFFKWCNSEDSKPYNSYGNGSAMRVSPVGYSCAGDLKGCLALAKEVAEATHNHPDGIKGAQVIAGCIHLARGGFKKDIYEFARKYYPNIEKLDMEILHKNYEFDVTCNGSVPVAVYAFLTSSSYINCLQIVNYIGGDTDTIGAMAGAIAEAYYGINADIEEEILKKLPTEMIDVIDRFNKYCITYVIKIKKDVVGPRIKRKDISKTYKDLTGEVSINYDAFRDDKGLINWDDANVYWLGHKNELDSQSSDFEILSESNFEDEVDEISKEVIDSLNHLGEENTNNKKEKKHENRNR